MSGVSWPYFNGTIDRVTGDVYLTAHAVANHYKLYEKTGVRLTGTESRPLTVAIKDHSQYGHGCADRDSDNETV